MTMAYGWLAAAYALAGHREKALKILEELDRIEKEQYFSPFKKIGFYLRPGLKPFRFMKRKYVTPLSKFVAYLAMNKQEETLEWLEKSVQERDYFLPRMTIFLDHFDFAGAEEIKIHPRFKSLKKKIKIKYPILHNDRSL
jgi:hypothetical protein